MPGHIIEAICPCGFEWEGTPGAYFSDGETVCQVMAYNPDRSTSLGVTTQLAENGEVEHLITIGEESARRCGLEVLEDPALDTDAGGTGQYGPWNGYRCPLCLQQTLSLSLMGFWD